LKISSISKIPTRFNFLQKTNPKINNIKKKNLINLKFFTDNIQNITFDIFKSILYAFDTNTLRTRLICQSLELFFVTMI